MYFRYGAGVTGGHVVMGAPAPAPTWYFAEGYTGPGFDEYLTILNPNPAPASVTITYYSRAAGRFWQSLTVAGRSRATVAVHEVRPNDEVAVRVETTAPGGIVVERPIYFTYNGAITGGHDALGATAPAATWYLAEGYTGTGFDEYITILNPNDSAAAVAITYYLASGQPRTVELTIGATARQTIAVHESAQGVGRGQEVAAKVTTTHPGGIVVERPMYFTYNGAVDGGHNVMGYAP
jgi:hypothetical protein